MTLEEKKVALAEAKAAQNLIDQLPADLRAWTMQYFPAMAEDVAAQETAAAGQARDSPVTSEFDFRLIVQTAGEVAWVVVKKHWPTASISAVLSALVSFAVSYLQK